MPRSPTTLPAPGALPDLPVMPAPLPSAGPRPERVDAARNRTRILDAAEALFAERGAHRVSMDEIAQRAGVGKGTLYRRFVDRSGLAFALLDERGAELQEALLRGPPPLGPGAHPQERLRAFLAALHDHTEAHIDLIFDADTSSPGARYRTGVYGAYHLHVVTLLRAMEADGEPAVLAHLLLAAFDAELHRHLAHAGQTREATLAGLEQLVAGLATGYPKR